MEELLFSNVYSVNNVRQTEIHTAEPLVPGSSQPEVEIVKLKKYKPPGSDQILTELIQTGGEILLSQIHKLTYSVTTMQELPDQWKESIIAPIHKKGDKTDYSNYHGITLLSSHKTLLKMIGVHRCGFVHNRSTTDQIIVIHQLLKKKWEHNQTVDQLFIDFKKAHDS
jgi:hypothetical protein